MGLVFVSIVFPHIAFGVEVVPLGKITAYKTGWSTHQVSVQIEGATYNEISECQGLVGYVVKKDPGNLEGYNTHVSALLAAFISDKRVQLILSGCVNNRPKIIGVTVVP